MHFACKINLSWPAANRHLPAVGCGHLTVAPFWHLHRSPMKFGFSHKQRHVIPHLIHTNICTYLQVCAFVHSLINKFTSRINKYNIFSFAEINNFWKIVKFVHVRKICGRHISQPNEPYAWRRHVNYAISPFPYLNIDNFSWRQSNSLWALPHSMPSLTIRKLKSSNSMHNNKRTCNNPHTNKQKWQEKQSLSPDKRKFQTSNSNHVKGHRYLADNTISSRQTLQRDV